MTHNDPGRKTFEIQRDLGRNTGEDKLEIKHLQQAVLNLYEKLDELTDENKQLGKRVEELENR